MLDSVVILHESDDGESARRESKHIWWDSCFWRVSRMIQGLGEDRGAEEPSGKDDRLPQQHATGTTVSWITLYSNYTSCCLIAEECHFCRGSLSWKKMTVYAWFCQWVMPKENLWGSQPLFYRYLFLRSFSSLPVNFMMAPLSQCSAPRCLLSLF